MICVCVTKLCNLKILSDILDHRACTYIIQDLSFVLIFYENENVISKFQNYVSIYTNVRKHICAN